MWLQQLHCLRAPGLALFREEILRQHDGSHRGIVESSDLSKFCEGFYLSFPGNIYWKVQLSSFATFSAGVRLGAGQREYPGASTAYHGWPQWPPREILDVVPYCRLGLEGLSST